MKKILGRKKKIAKSKRITTETLEEHRESVLSNGRKFKYPLQYAKHRLVVNTVIIGVAAVVLLGLFGWLQLYKFQTMNDVFYRFTRVIPVPVARVDREWVRYSDYLMIYKSSVTALENQEGALGDDDEDKMMKAEFKRQALDTAEEFAYALKLAKELDVEVTREQILEAEKEHRTVDGAERSEESFTKIIKANFGLSVVEYERLLMLSLTKREVSAQIDKHAGEVASRVEKMLAENDGDFWGVVEGMAEEVIYEETGELVDEMNLDGGRAVEASKLEVGQWTKRFLSKNGDGWYFVKLLAKGDGQVNYVSLRVPFKEFGERMTVLMDEGKITEYIKLEGWVEEEFGG